MTGQKKFYSEFLSWLCGLVEDDPIPYEIKSLVFFVNSHAEIGFSGFEENKINVIDFGFYFPLEAEFFFCPKLFSSSKNEVLQVLKSLLEKLSTDSYFGKFNLFYGFLFERAKKI